MYCTPKSSSYRDPGHGCSHLDPSQQHQKRQCSIFTSADGYTNSSGEKSYKRNSNIDFDGGKKEDLKIIFLLSGKIFTLNGGCNYFKLVKRSL